MRRFVVAMTLIIVGAVGSGCRPSYPACRGDEDCNRDQPRGEFCVNQLCQKCRTDKDCHEGEQCNKGRCDAVVGYCSETPGLGCPGDQVCKEHRCTTCESDAECPGGGKCKKGRCLARDACETDDQCPEGQDCKNGKCVGGPPPKAPQNNTACKLSPVYFDFNESALNNEATAAIDANVACIKQVGRPVRIIGHSDPRGTEEYNMALSERRGQEVQTRMERLGLLREKLSVLPMGELDATGKDEAGWANDRRVEFEWL